MNSCSRKNCCFGALAEIVTLCFSSSADQRRVGDVSGL